MKVRLSPFIFLYSFFVNGTPMYFVKKLKTSVVIMPISSDSAGLSSSFLSQNNSYARGSANDPSGLFVKPKENGKNQASSGED